MRKLLHIFLSLVIVFAPAYSYAANSTWYPQSVVVTGSTALITAAKQGFRSSVSHVPSVGSVARSLAKGTAPLALLLAVTQQLGDSVDWVLDAENNAVKYTTPYVDKGADTVCYHKNNRENMVAGTFCALNSQPFTKITLAGQVQCGGAVYSALSCPKPVPVDNYLPLSELANKVIANAASGHYESQKVIKDAATDDIYSGAIEGKLTANQVESDAPFDPTRPNDPASTPFDASSLIAAMQSVMSAINNMSSSLKAKLESIGLSLGSKLDSIVEGQTETNKVINESVDRVIENDNVRVGEIVSAIEAIEGNTLDGKVINDAVDKAIAEGKTNTSDIVAAIEAIEGNTLDGQVINDAVDRVITNDDVNSQATQDVISQSADKVIDAVDASSVSVTDAIDAQTDAITEVDPVTGDLSLKFPAFCGWASPVCAFIDWSREQFSEFILTFVALKDWLFEETSPTDTDNTITPSVPPVVPVQVAIDFVGGCPAPLGFDFNFYGRSYHPAIPFTPICDVAILINPIIKICATIAAAYIVAGIRQGSN